MTRHRDLPEAAAIALRCLDLTSLGDADTAADVERLCVRAQTPFGPVAAVCVWPRFAALARSRLPASIGVAAVANFPAGGADVDAALQDVHQIVAAGAQEVDVVLPWRALQACDEAAARRLLAAVRAASPGMTLKVILEAGELREPALIERAARLAIAAGADFLKTSTGKVAVGATLPAAAAMLRAIAADPRARGRVGLKLAGGLRRVADVLPYLELAARELGEAALQPQRLRIGASSLLDDIEAVLGGGAAGAAGPQGGY
ncbi:MAG TPA: deoxyribose-phosphate aldolase [Rubrivivax sp.]|nr:deoxyribose-phosphate aldolase [Rubrivivax sp.]